ncbi:MAG: hypothetical protein O3A96_04490 [Proteobacteria bacterium]|nr:hypothetical protein [Pseudomonadota bacterium]
MTISRTETKPGQTRPQNAGRRPAYLPAAAVVLLFGALILGAIGSAEGAVLSTESVETAA